MPTLEPRSLPSSLLGLSLTLLASAIALNIAVDLIRSIWTTLVLIAAVVGLLAGIVSLIRHRSRGW